MFFYCTKFNMPPFLTEEWKTVGEFEAILRDASRLTTIFQNEERMNGAHGHVMGIFFNDSLSGRTMCMINAGLWSSKKR